MKKSLRTSFLIVDVSSKTIALARPVAMLRLLIHYYLHTLRYNSRVQDEDYITLYPMFRLFLLLCVLIQQSLLSMFSPLLFSFADDQLTIEPDYIYTKVKRERESKGYTIDRSCSFFFFKRENDCLTERRRRRCDCLRNGLRQAERRRMKERIQV